LNARQFLCVNGVPIKRYDFSVEPEALVPDIDDALKAALAARMRAKDEV
jgi:hypothetical protein